MTRALRPLLLLACALAACESITSPDFPSTAIRFTPPSIYREWWSMTEACSGRTGSFDAISWYMVPNSDVLPGTDFSGEWYSSGRIVIAAGDDQISAGNLVRHEMLHALVPQGGHPRDLFVGRCGGIVLCIEDCLAGGGSPPPLDPAARPEPPESLRVSVDVNPSAPSSAIWDGFFMMTIHARNPSSHPVVVQLPPSGDDGPPVSFSYNLTGYEGGVWFDMRADTPEVTRFAAGETKDFVFDFHNKPGQFRYELSPGTWLFKGAYGHVWATASPVVTVGP